MTTQGMSVSLFGRPLDALTVNLGAIYTDATYGAGYFVTCGQLQTAAQGCLPVFNSAGVQIGTADDADGNRIIGAPEWKVTANVEYAKGFSNRLEAFVQADAVYTSRVNFSAAYDPIASTTRQPSLAARLGLRNADQRYGVSLFVRNLFDTYQPVVRFETPTAAQQGDPHSYSQISGAESRRVIGLSFDARL